MTKTLLAAGLSFLVFATPATVYAQSATSKKDLVDRMWVEENPQNRLPGVMALFGSDGTLLQTSCWETYRLSKWKESTPKKLSWNEDGLDISAEIASVSTTKLVLRIGVGKNTVEHRYRRSKAPYVCPEMPK